MFERPLNGIRGVSVKDTKSWSNMTQQEKTNRVKTMDTQDFMKLFFSRENTDPAIFGNISKEEQMKLDDALGARILHFLVDQLGGDVTIPRDVVEGTGSYADFEENKIHKDDQDRQVIFYTAKGYKKRLDKMANSW